MAALPIVPSANPPFEDRSLATDEVPQLYRQVLDMVAELERAGARADAARARAQAIAAYSRAWDEPARRRLRRIADDLDRRLHGRGLRSRLHLG